jgi:hypothetical protein
MFAVKFGRHSVMEMSFEVSSFYWTKLNRFLHRYIHLRTETEPFSETPLSIKRIRTMDIVHKHSSLVHIHHYLLGCLPCNLVDVHHYLLACLPCNMVDIHPYLLGCLPCNLADIHHFLLGCLPCNLVDINNYLPECLPCNLLAVYGRYGRTLETF